MLASLWAIVDFACCNTCPSAQCLFGMMLLETSNVVLETVAHCNHLDTLLLRQQKSGHSRTSVLYITLVNAAWQAMEAARTLNDVAAAHDIFLVAATRAAMVAKERTWLLVLQGVCRLLDLVLRFADVAKVLPVFYT